MDSANKAGTPIENFFSPNIAKQLVQKYHILTIEHLLSLGQIPDMLNGLADDLGMKQEHFDAVLQKAKSSVDVPQKSGRKYPLGITAS